MMMQYEQKEYTVRKSSSIILAALLALGSVTTGSAAFAGQPGPGDKQCVPGQNANPQPGFKAGVCNNR